METVRLIGYRLRSYGFTTLDSYYKSKKWKQVKERLKKARESGYKCEVCSATDRLQVHHKSYKSLCNENLNHLAVLCFVCHTACHKLAEKKNWSLWYATKKIRRGARKKAATVKSREARLDLKKKRSVKIRGDRHMKGLCSKTFSHKSVDLNAKHSNSFTSYFVDPSTL